MAGLRLTFGNNLERARKARKLSREALAGVVECDPLTIRNYEKGIRWPDPETIERIAAALLPNPPQPWELTRPDGDPVAQRMDRASLIGGVVLALDPLQEDKLLAVLRFIQSLGRGLKHQKDLGHKDR